MGVHEKLSEVQRKLKAPKNQHNSFGNYNYRSCEDILEGVKPLLDDATLYITDEIVQVGERFYVKATATFRSGPDSITASAYAREQTDKKGMDQSQVTGAASSYARKYALNGLFLIDDTKDADTMDNRNGEQPDKKDKAKKEQAKPTTLTPDHIDHIIGMLKDVKTTDEGKICKAFGVGKLEDIPDDKFSSIVDGIQVHIDKAKAA